MYPGESRKGKRNILRPRAKGCVGVLSRGDTFVCGKSRERGVLGKGKKNVHIVLNSERGIMEKKVQGAAHRWGKVEHLSEDPRGKSRILRM